MQSMPARIATLLVAVFVVVGALVMLAAQVDSTPGSGLSAPLVIGLLAVTLVAAWCVLQALVQPLLAQQAAQLAQLSDLVRQQRLLQTQALEQRRELLANLSHDLRTPLASMQGYLELLLLRHDQLDAAEAHNYLQTATRQCERLSRLVGDLFDLTRLEADDMQPQAEAFALAELAQDVVQKYAVDARRRDVTLQTRCDGTPGPAPGPTVQADIALIERLLDNLVDNALRHTPAGGAVTIDIDRATGSAPARVQMAVCDTGVGIAADDLPGLFERYDRASRVGDAGGHAGLGLAIARRIVGLHGSQLNVHSTPGQGTRVSFDLALASRGTTGRT